MTNHDNSPGQAHADRCQTWHYELESFFFFGCTMVNMNEEDDKVIHNSRKKKKTCNTADYIFVLSDALHHPAVIQGYYQETVFPTATCDQKVFRWHLQCSKALFSKLNIFSQGSRDFAR